MKKEIKLFFIFILVIILGILQIIVSNRLSNYGRKIDALSKKTQELVIENERLKKKIASDSAVTNLTEKAAKLGFTQKASTYYLDELYSVAQNSL